jgi:hypothetical protein
VDPVLQEAYTHPLGSGHGIPEATYGYPGPLVAFDGARAVFVSWCPSCGAATPFAALESTSDGGATWSHSDIKGPEQPGGFAGASFLDPSHGWILIPDAAAGSLLVLETTDGGATWVEP